MTDFDLLIRQLDHTFFKAKGVSARHRQRYIQAISYVCEYLNNKGAPPEIVIEMAELCAGLKELDRGIIRPFLLSKRHGRTTDPDDIWVCRAALARAAQELEKGGISLSQALQRVGEECASLAPLISPTSKEGLSVTLKGWLQRLAKADCKSEQALLYFRQVEDCIDETNFETRAARLMDEAFRQALGMDATRVSRDALQRFHYDATRRNIRPAQMF